MSSVTSGGFGLAAQARLLCQIFEKKDAKSDEERDVLSRLEPGALAQACARTFESYMTVYLIDSDRI